jgi:hypothetical protein
MARRTRIHIPSRAGCEYPFSTCRLAKAPNAAISRLTLRRRPARQLATKRRWVGNLRGVGRNCSQKMNAVTLTLSPPQRRGEGAFLSCPSPRGRIISQLIEAVKNRTRRACIKEKTLLSRRLIRLHSMQTRHPKRSSLARRSPPRGCRRVRSAARRSRGP